MESSQSRAHSNAGPSRRHRLIYFGCLLAILLFFFAKSLAPSQIVASNDGPLGAVNAEFVQPPPSFKAIWQDLNSIGFYAGSYSPAVTGALFWMLGPLYFSKFYVPLTLLFAGFSGWFLFRRIQLWPIACSLGGIAVVLNSDVFSTAAWGVGPQVICFGMNFLALAALCSPSSSWQRRWVKVCLAGFAVGVGVIEGADIGAIFSIVIASFVLYQSLVNGEGSVPAVAQRFGAGIARIATVAVCAGFIATHMVAILVGTQIQGVVGMQQDAETRAQRWNEATQWSLPKTETLGLFVPGLFGYRMDTPGDMVWFEDKFKGAHYWGAVGRDPALDEYFAGGRQGPAPQGLMRFSGGGAYAGVVVVLVALWTALQSLRRKDSVFTRSERRFLWFWAAAVIVSVLLAYGRFAPFYQFVYALPYFSTIRNPTKFLHVFSFSILILFAYGIHGLARRYLETAVGAERRLSDRLSHWWKNAAPFDRRWVVGAVVAVAASLVGWIIYANSREALESYLAAAQLGETAANVAQYSIRQVGWFVLFLAATVAVTTLILSGAFGGRRAKWAGILLGVILVGDLARADLPWLLYWNYKQKYEIGNLNPVVRFLQEDAHEHRVAILPQWIPSAFQLQGEVAAAQSRLTYLYELEWKQHLHLYYNIQSLDVVQMPREPEDLHAYRSTLSVTDAQSLRNVVRHWELTNTRYILALAGFADLLDRQFDDGRGRFQIAHAFDLVPKPGIAGPSRWADLTAQTSTNGPYALIEFTGALPRASLYSDWQVGTNNLEILAAVSSAAFNPQQTTLVAAPAPAPPASVDTNRNAGTVQYISYAPKEIRLKAEASAPSILLLNDKYDPNWKVRVDGKPAELLRCNFIMRGVYLDPGSHEVEFRFLPNNQTLYVTLAAIALAIGLCGYLVFTGRNAPPQEPARADKRHPGKAAA